MRGAEKKMENILTARVLKNPVDYDCKKLNARANHALRRNIKISARVKISLFDFVRFKQFLHFLIREK